MITSDSTSGGGAPEFKVVIDSLPDDDLAVGSSIVLYLEDDYQEPATIPASSVYFVAEPNERNQDGEWRPGVHHHCAENRHGRLL